MNVTPEIRYVNQLPSNDPAIYGQQNRLCAIGWHRRGWPIIYFKKGLSKREQELASAYAESYLEFYATRKDVRGKKSMFTSAGFEDPQTVQSFETIVESNELFTYLMSHSPVLTPRQQSIGQMVKAQYDKQQTIIKTAFLREAYAATKNQFTSDPKLKTPLKTGINIALLAEALAQTMQDTDQIQNIKDDPTFLKTFYTEGVHEQERISIVCQNKILHSYEDVKAFLLKASGEGFKPKFKVDHTATESTGELTVRYQFPTNLNPIKREQLKTALKYLWGNKVYLKPALNGQFKSFQL